MALLRIKKRKDAGGHGTVGGGSFKVTKREDAILWEEAETELALRLLKRLRLPRRGDFHAPFRQA